ncbi:MAG: hypothetical protein JW870_19230 [Candidatus Delongbacteria bacterium]|nr:hypothetical protein [Candidatus Delongbacteria bacterium]
MSEAKQILDNVINDFSIDKFIRFFREISRQFVAHEENYSRYNDDDFKNGLKLGEINFSDSECLIICAFKVKKELSERAGKKTQYEKAKNLLKSFENQKFSAGIFIFYDAKGNFRFSLVYPESIGTRRQWNNFRRFTYFVSKELTNKTFKQRIGNGDLSSLTKIKDAFSVEKVTKEFYECIANWYFWAVELCHFPKDAESEENGRNTAVIRLITRMIFIWFMRERCLVPKELFDEKCIVSILKNISADDSTYYTTILQNLFFATLSTKKEERQFGSEIKGYKGYNPDFGNQYVFRYQENFSNSDAIKKYFGNIPFLNGGLFECLDDKKNGIIIDGFSRTKKNQPFVPNYLFFSNEINADLNKAYGTINKTYKVRGLLDILSSFNFTIDENSPDDADVALDPELLGRVFENLLASFNPETSTTARKATGSYYTPREIVNYMVEESLKEYFKTHLEGIEKTDNKIENLFSVVNQGNPFDDQESIKIVELIENVRIVDPAVGSGAFPMGALNKLVFILNKLDPGNELWKQAQLKAANAIPDPSVRREAKRRIEDFFQSKNADYGRKLYLIQRCIYGVDIQQIAVEIAKLRFFISLLVDEKIEEQKDNWGIEPLPNLDFKIVQGNSLISEFLGIDFDNEQELNKLQKQTGFDFKNEVDSIIEEFERRKIDYQNESDKDIKAKIKNDVEDLMIKIFEINLQNKYSELKSIEVRAQGIPNLKTKEEYIRKEKERFSKKHGIDIENTEKQLREFTSKKKARQFFPWKLYFAEVFKEKGGFDIVIGNPPWGQKSVKFLESEKKLFKIKYPSATIGILDISRLFVERAITILNARGSFANVLPDIILLKNYNSTRKYILDNLLINRIDHWGTVFENVNLDSITLMGNKVTMLKKSNNIVECTIHTKKGIIKNKIIQAQFLLADGYKFNLFLNSGVCELFDKLKRNKKMGDYFDPHEGIHSGNIRDKLFIDKKINDNCKKLIFGREEIGKYHLLWNGKWVNYNKNIIDKVNGEYAGLGKPEYFEKHKIVVRRTGDFILGTLDEDGYYFSNNLFVCVPKKDLSINLKYVLGILNSKLATWFYRTVQPREGKIFAELKINVLKQIPIKESSLSNQKTIIELVDKILIAKKNKLKIDTSIMENAINKLVYDIFELTEEQRQTIETSLLK